MARYKTDVSMLNFRMEDLLHCNSALCVLEDELTQFIQLRESNGWEVVNITCYPGARVPFTLIQFRKEIRETRDTGPK